MRQLIVRLREGRMSGGALRPAFAGAAGGGVERRENRTALQPHRRDKAAQQDLHNDLYALIVRMNKSGDTTMVVPSEYLEVVIS